MASTTIKVSVETRDRLRTFGGATYEETIINALDALEEDRFWEQADAAATWRASLPEAARARLKAHAAAIDAAFDAIA